MPTPTYDLIASTVLSSSASSVTFSSISQDYRDLVLVCKTDNVTVVRVNSDTSSIYYNVRAAGNGSSTASSTFDEISWFSASNYGTSGLSMWQFMDYSVTDKHKTVLSRVNDSTANVSMAAHRWASTSAITALEVTTLGNGNYSAGSTFYLYGVA
jgi:hypothetical protein